MNESESPPVLGPGLLPYLTFPPLSSSPRWPWRIPRTRTRWWWRCREAPRWSTWKKPWRGSSEGKKELESCTPLKTNMTLENPHFQQGSTCSNWWVFAAIPCQFSGGYSLASSKNPPKKTVAGRFQTQNWAFQAQRGASNLGYLGCCFKRGMSGWWSFGDLFGNPGPKFPIKWTTCFPGLIHSLLRDNWSSHFSRRYNLHMCVLLGWFSHPLTQLSQMGV